MRRLRFNAIKVIHWYSNDDHQFKSGPIELQQFPRFEAVGDTAELDKILLTIRWTFRAGMEDAQMMSLITEQDVSFLFSDHASNVHTMQQIWLTSHSNFEEEFEKKKPGTWMRNASLPPAPPQLYVIQDLLSQLENDTQS